MSVQESCPFNVPEKVTVDILGTPVVGEDTLDIAVFADAFWQTNDIELAAGRALEA